MAQEEWTQNLSSNFKTSVLYCLSEPGSKYLKKAKISVLKALHEMLDS